MSHFRPILRDVDFLLPPSIQDWLPDGHLARYVVEVIEGLDLREIERAYAGRGSLPYHPAMLLSLLIYGYATGCFSSRKIERATDDSLAFRFIAANTHPDHATLATFRKRFAQEFEATFVQVWQVARENQLSRFGTVSLDGHQDSRQCQPPQRPVRRARRSARSATKGRGPGTAGVG
jgi:transposase